MKATVLYYQLSLEKEEALCEAVSLLGATARRVEKADAGQKVGTLAGVEGMDWEAEADAPKVIDAEVLVMCGFTQLQFQLLMAMFQKKKIPSVAIKAMMTPTNQDWCFAKLIGELKVEHALMTKQKKK